MRIVSLVPAATEIVFALGLGDELVGRSHLCDYPPEALDVPVVTAPDGSIQGASMGGERLAGARRRLEHAAHGGGPLRLRDPGVLADLAPDLVLLHRLCGACSAIDREVGRQLDPQHEEVSVIGLEPVSIEGIFNSISTVGAFAEAEDEAVGLLEMLRERLGAIENLVLERRLMGIAPRRAVLLEWLDPPLAAGAWLPEMVRRAGGWDLLGRDGEVAGETTWERVREMDPEQLIMAPAGMHAGEAADAYGRLALPAWFDDLRAVREGGLFAVDGGGLFVRPGPRVTEGIGLLAELFDPEGLIGSAAPGSWVPLPPAAMRAATTGQVAGGHAGEG